MIKLVKSLILVVALLSLTFCSSKQDNGDIQVSDIETVESSSDFNESDFISDSEGDDLFADGDDVDLEVNDSFSDGGSLEGEELGEIDDFFDDNMSDGAVTEVMDDQPASQVVGDVELDADFNDLEGDILNSDQSASELIGDVNIDADFSEDAALNSDQSASELIGDVNIDADFSEDIALNSTDPASELVGDVNIDANFDSNLTASATTISGGGSGNSMSDDEILNDPRPASQIVGSVSIGYVNFFSKPVPVKKIKTAPFTYADTLLNTVYIVRPGDTVRSIKSMIYGSDSRVNLVKTNPHLGCCFGPGQKVYYNSPNRPNDNSRMMVYFEDIGQQPEYFQAGSGQNVRTLSSQLVGYNGAWKEVWAYNPSIESKGSLQAEHNIKYWPMSSSQNLAGMCASHCSSVKNAANNNRNRPVVKKTVVAPKPVVNKAPAPKPVAKAPAPAPKPVISKAPAPAPKPVAKAPTPAPNTMDNKKAELNKPSVAGTINDNNRAPAPVKPTISAQGAESQRAVKTTAELLREKREKRKLEEKRKSLAREKLIAKRKSQKQKQMLTIGGVMGFFILALLFLVFKKRKKKSGLAAEDFDFGDDSAIDQATNTSVEL